MMSAGELATKYIQKTERALIELKIICIKESLDSGKVNAIIDEAKRYLEDARYYVADGKPETGLASVAYCEGLLDALRLLGFVEFSW